MRDGWERRPLGDLLELTITRLPVEGGRDYDLAGVYGFGRGLFRRERLRAEDTSYKHLHALRAGQFVMSKLKALEGAVTVVGPEFDGAALSPEFPTYAINDELILPEYLALLTTHRPFWALLAEKSTGMGGRKERVHQTRILELEVDLPPVRRQRRAVDLVTAIGRAAALSAIEAERAADTARSILYEHVGATSDRRPLGELVEFRYGRALKESDRAGGSVPVFGAAGEVGGHDVSTAPAGTVIVGRKGVHALASLPQQLRSDAGLRDLYRGPGGAGTVSWSERPCWVIDTAYVAVPRLPIDSATLYWTLVVADLPSVATKTTLPGLSRDTASEVTVPVLANAGWARVLSSIDALEQVARAAILQAGALRDLRLGTLAELLGGAHEIPAVYDELLDRAS